MSFLVRKVSSVFKTFDMMADVSSRIWRGMKWLGKLVVLILCNATKALSDLGVFIHQKLGDEGPNSQRKPIMERHALGERVLDNSFRKRRHRERRTRGKRVFQKNNVNEQSETEGVNVIVAPRPRTGRRTSKNGKSGPSRTENNHSKREHRFSQDRRRNSNVDHHRSGSPTPTISSNEGETWEDAIPRNAEIGKSSSPIEIGISQGNTGTVNMIYDNKADAEFAFWNPTKPNEKKTLTLYHVRGFLEGVAQPFSFLVDSGSAVSVLPRKKIQKLGCSVSNMGQGTRMVGFSGSIEKALGSVAKKVTVGKATRKLKFLVSEKATKPILGLDALKAFGMVINTEEGSLESTDGGKVYCHCVEVQMDEGPSEIVPADDEPKNL